MLILLCDFRIIVQFISLCEILRSFNIQYTTINGSLSLQTEKKPYKSKKAPSSGAFNENPPTNFTETLHEKMG